MRKHSLSASSTAAPRRRAQAGVSLVELMVAITLGMIVMAALASLFASSSAARQELERTSRQIENGRFAIELIGDDLRLAGFYGELQAAGFAVPGVLPDPCSVLADDWKAAIPLHVFGYDDGVGLPTCLPGTVKAGTDVMVIRRAATCESGTPECEPVQGGRPYVQVSKCSDENSILAYRLGLNGVEPFDRRLRDCTNRAGLRQYIVRIYFISTNNGKGQDIPTLKRMDFTGTGFVETPLVEGIEELNIEWGIDWNNDGIPDGYNADPSTFAGCVPAANCGAILNWANAMTARISVLARNIDPSPNYTDTKTYTIGRDALGNEVTRTPGGAYRRHVYQSLVRVVNAAERRQRP